ncbi:MAG: hypothetical protein QM687_10290 [Ferruginibacter sp.]
MDNLKKYIQQHEQEMDFDAPAPEVWNRIEKAASKKTTGKVITIPLRFAAAAAAVLFVVTLSVQLLRKPEQPSKEETAVKPALPVPEKTIAPENPPAVTIPAPETTPAKNLTAKIEKSIPPAAKKADRRYAMMKSFKENYGQLVSYQLAAIRSTPVYAEDPAYFNDFKMRLQQMDADEINIRRTIRQQGMSNQLLEQLINVYQQKLDVLKSLQAEINKMNERVIQVSPADSSKRYYLNI